MKLTNVLFVYTFSVDLVTNEGDGYVIKPLLVCGLPLAFKLQYWFRDLHMIFMLKNCNLPQTAVYGNHCFVILLSLVAHFGTNGFGNGCVCAF